jgi:hypothetical protein
LADPDILADPAVVLVLPTAVLFASDPAEAEADTEADAEAPVAEAEAEAAAGGGVKLMAFFPPGGRGLRRVVLGCWCFCCCWWC